MRKLLLMVGFVLCLPLVGMAQDTPKAEIFTGYSYVRADGEANLHGWNLSIAGNANNWFGVVADFAGHYEDGPDLHSFLFGPKFTYRGDQRINPYFQTLFGAARISNGGSDTDFGMTVGGGLDVKIHDRVAVRVIEGSYYMTRFGDDSQHHVRLSTGLVWRF